MAWFALIIAGLCEVFGVINIKRLTMKKWDALIYLTIGFILSFAMLTYAMKTISMGTAYGVWTGIGTVGSALVGMYMYNEPKEWTRIFFIGLILAATIGLKVIS
ncbi:MULTISPECIES: DMT family transporter [Niallia]|uniref:QacE family quaternary ammonium compound efflux SMR transporter n=1 Tax=Niallia nealsonii TaxID=115979 RepID=A0A2N0Z337_9BACI|nr:MULTISPECIES: multidrug efflux SMR transporter [Niallia]PKG23899.1 QacE family quaternary ammonium compound efflux SMR transporter [Niallia nealsonii]